MPKTDSAPHIVIIGAGPCGLGAAWRLTEVGHTNFDLYERNSYAGGLAASFRDEAGFTWDIGGHVLFSHYDYFDSLMDSLLPGEWLQHEREAWCYFRDRFVPYPFQYNLHRLDPADRDRCLRGLRAAAASPQTTLKNFREWIIQSFGQGIADLFMLPYNYKVWAYPPEMMSYSWIGERVARVDMDRLERTITTGQDDISWGPNHTFRFPRAGGTGEIWRRLAARIPSARLHYNQEVTSVDPVRKKIIFADGNTTGYDHLITTMPLDILLQRSLPREQIPSGQLLHSSTHVIGVGIRGEVPDTLRTKGWMYFSEDICPFYRATVFSNYAGANVPEVRQPCWSVMLEVSESPFKTVSKAPVLREQVIKGLLATGMLSSPDDVIDVWYRYEPYGYPTPSLERDLALQVLDYLEEVDIYSRGRFGSFRYEIGNQDHTLMQGVEVVDRLLSGQEEVTVNLLGRTKRGEK